MLVIAGGIVLGFLAIRFLLAWEHEGRAGRSLEARARSHARSDEQERLRLLALRLQETNRALYDEAAARVPRPAPKLDPNRKVCAVDDATGAVHSVWPSELEGSRLRVPVVLDMRDIAREAEAICRERGLPPP